MPKIGNWKIVRHPVIEGRLQFTQITTINKHLLIKIRQNNLIRCHGNYIEVNKFDHMLEIDILRNSSQNVWVS